MKKLTILGRLPGLNEYIAAERQHRQKAAKLKRDTEERVLWCAKVSLRGWKAKGPIIMHYTWYEPDRRRDKDNISAYGRKVIQDALVKGGYLKNDGWSDIEGFTDAFSVDRKRPRVEVVIEEL